MEKIKSFEEFCNDLAITEGVVEEGKAYFKGLSKSTSDKKKKQMKKQAAMADDDPEAYKEMPGDKEGKKTQKTSKHTKKYHKMFEVDEDFEWDEIDENELLEEEIDEKQSTDSSSITSDKIETALKKKAEKTGVSLTIIRQVMRRGLAAWKTGHRPGASQEQWGYARVNSFLTKSKGTWGGADKDLAAKVRGKS